MGGSAADICCRTSFSQKHKSLEQSQQSVVPCFISPISTYFACAAKSYRLKIIVWRKHSLLRGLRIPWRMQTVVAVDLGSKNGFAWRSGGWERYEGKGEGVRGGVGGGSLLRDATDVVFACFYCFTVVASWCTSGLPRPKWWCTLLVARSFMLPYSYIVHFYLVLGIILSISLAGL